jgi:hypothetical protein
VAPYEFATRTVEKLVDVAPELSAPDSEAHKLADAADWFAIKPVSVLVVASPSLPNVHAVVEYLRYRLPGETVEVAQHLSVDAAMRAARSCAVVLCLLDDGFFRDERALTALTWAYMAKAEVRGARVPAREDGAAYQHFCHLGGPRSSLVGVDLVARLDGGGSGFGASDLFDALVALALAYHRCPRCSTTSVSSAPFPRCSSAWRRRRPCPCSCPCNVR